MKDYSVEYRILDEPLMTARLALPLPKSAAMTCRSS